MTTVHWLKPAPLWSLASQPPATPWLARFDGDAFLNDFTAVLASGQPGDIASAQHTPAPPPDSSQLKLYLPLHGAYYLVCASLVCAQVGLPDRRVRAQDNERATFVVRRLRGGSEQAWVDQGPNRGWQPLVDPARGTQVLVRADEERFPLHPAPVPHIPPPVNPDAASNPLALAAGCCRTVQFGYLATGNRVKYQAPQPVASGDAAAHAQLYADSLAASNPEESDLRLSEVDERIIGGSPPSPPGAWKALLAENPDTATLHSTSLYLLIDLGDVLQRNLGPVFDALTGGPDLPVDASFTDRRALRDALHGMRITRVSSGVADADFRLSSGLAERKGDLGLAYGQGTEPADPQYDLKSAKQQNGVSAVDSAYLDTLRGLFAAGLVEQKTDDQNAGRPWLRLTPLAAQLLADQVEPEPPIPTTGGAAQLEEYWVRLVYERPGCRPIVSEPTQQFALAPPFDPDAPARHIRIELPSIKPKDMRKYARGVGLAMSPELRDVMGRVNKDMLKGNGLSGSPGGLSLGMICSFSLSIIFLVAFIVMFIFLILLNIVFWWMAFLRICFPIPRRSS